MRTMRFTLVLAVALAVPAIMANEVYATGNQIEGLWDVVVTITACQPGDPAPMAPPIRAMIMFTRDGKVIETAGSPLVGAPLIQRVSPGLGAWQRLGERNYSAAFTFFRINVPAILSVPPVPPGTPVPSVVPFSFAGTQTITEDIELSHDGSEFTAIGTSQIVNADGATLPETCNALAGVRRP